MALIKLCFGYTRVGFLFMMRRWLVEMFRDSEQHTDTDFCGL